MTRHAHPLTVLSPLVAIVVVSIGVCIVGYRCTGVRPLAAAGVLTGLGVAAMHYLGMAAMRLDGEPHYSVTVIALSVVIAACAALWAAINVRGFLPSLCASLVMGLAVSGMHYTGMAAVSVELHMSDHESIGRAPTSLVLPMLIGPVIFLVVAGVIVMFDPVLILGDWNQSSAQRQDAEARVAAEADTALIPPAA
ncbi:MHYT domain-containing protein [Streptomyces sp. NPDC048254]|uniref:MHYT domain-containing protein n=1 Tax=Streptomyces sp. NPDC048254 TaxID=3365525 RepID=UPI00371FDF60